MMHLLISVFIFVLENFRYFQNKTMTENGDPTTVAASSTFAASSFLVNQPLAPNSGRSSEFLCENLLFYRVQMSISHRKAMQMN